MQMRTTKISTLFDDINAKMTGKETFPISPPDGGYLSYDDACRLLEKCKGLNPYFNCLEKAKLVQSYLGYGRIVIGGLLVWNKDMNANFGYYFNPPFEFHAWWEPDDPPLGSTIVDIALPGVIQKGLNTIDEIGPMIEKRKPFILVGNPLDWTEYSPKYVLNRDN